RINETALRRELRMAGHSPKVPDGKRVSSLEMALSAIQKQHDVAYSGALAGCKAGLHEFDGHRVLVTESPRLITPADGDWPIIRALIEGALNDSEHEQSPFVYGWLKIAVEALFAGHRRPGQALVLAGVHDCGKS